MNNELWEKCISFHGHDCPGLAIGFKACEAAMKKMGIQFSKDEEVVCVTENDACGVDAVQVITGCTMGKGNLIYRGTGKMAYSFFNRSNGDCIRLVLKDLPEKIDRKEAENYILNAPVDEVFDVKKPHFNLPERARLFSNVICEECGESVPEHKARINDGKNLCLDCFKEYSRGW